MKLGFCNLHKIASIFVIACILFACSLPSIAQERKNTLMAGIRLQKTHNLYWENGVTFDYTNSSLWDERVHLGLSYVTSRLGTAMNSNAIKQDNYLLSAGLHLFKNKRIEPLIRINTGWFNADMEEEIFSVLPHTSFLFSVEGGLMFDFDLPLIFTTSIGYNFITGDGISRPGTLYPLYYQFSFSSRIR